MLRWGKGLIWVQHWLQKLVDLLLHVVAVDFLQDGLHVRLSKLRLTGHWFKDLKLFVSLIGLIIDLILALFLLFDLHLLDHRQHFLMFLNVGPRSCILAPIVLLLDLQHLVQIYLRQSFTFLRQQA